MSIFELLAVFFGGVSLGALGSVSIVAWGATRCKNKDDKAE